MGDNLDLLIDAGLVWDSKTALQRARAGYLQIPREPGLGIELDEKALRKDRIA